MTTKNGNRGPSPCGALLLCCVVALIGCWREHEAQWVFASPIFRRFDNDLLHQTNCTSIAQTELNKVMGDGIPVISVAAGANDAGWVAEYGIISPR